MLVNCFILGLQRMELHQQFVDLSAILCHLMHVVHFLFLLLMHKYVVPISDLSEFLAETAHVSVCPQLAHLSLQL